MTYQHLTLLFCSFSKAKSTVISVSRRLHTASDECYRCASCKKYADLVFKSLFAFYYSKLSILFIDFVLVRSLLVK